MTVGALGVETWRSVSDGRPVVVGVVHLPALPGSVQSRRALADVVAWATADARALVAGGVDGVIVENFGDAPFERGAVSPVCVAAMTRVVGAVREAAPGVGLGVNVLRNDALAALAVAAATGADAVRVNVLTGAMVTDQGLIEGDARAVMAARAAWCPKVHVLADVLVKHAAPLGAPVLEDVARDTAHRALADVLVVTGSGTGQPTDLARVERVRSAVPGHPVWVGSGVTLETAPGLRGRAHGAIVGTWLHEDGDVRRPIDAGRVARLVAACAGA